MCSLINCAWIVLVLIEIRINLVKLSWCVSGFWNNFSSFVKKWLIMPKLSLVICVLQFWKRFTIQTRSGHSWGLYIITKMLSSSSNFYIPDPFIKNHELMTKDFILIYIFCCFRLRDRILKLCLLYINWGKVSFNTSKIYYNTLWI